MRRRSQAAIISVLLVAILIFVGVFWAWSTAVAIFQPTNAGQSGQNVSLVISKGETAKMIADDLQKKGLIRNALAFEVWARIKGLDRSLQAGVYKKLHPGMTISDIITQLQNAQPDASNVLIVEGWRLEQIAQAFANADPKLPNFVEADFLKYAKNINEFPDASKDPVLALRPAGENSMEGLLFPSTYEIPVNANATTVLDIMLNTTYSVLQQNNLIKEAQQHQLSAYKLLILASIVEREAVYPADRGNIASVYWNRLFSANGFDQTRGLLEADPTVQYARDTLTPPKTYWLPLTDAPADIAPNSAWNTYNVVGLPPTPICSPGLASLQAAAQPPQTNYLYFFAKKDGHSVFATTLQQFQELQAQDGVSS